MVLEGSALSDDEGIRKGQIWLSTLTKEIQTYISSFPVYKYTAKRGLYD